MSKSRKLLALACALALCGFAAERIAAAPKEKQGHATPAKRLGIGREATGILALGLFEGAFAAEIIRAGIQSVPRGQREAADSLDEALALASEAPELLTPATTVLHNFLAERRLE